MYSKDQASAIKQAFWTALGQYMTLSPSAEGEKINWINYKTGIKNLHFKMQVDGNAAIIEIELTHPDPGIQELMMEQLKEYKKILQDYVGEEWQWEIQVPNDHNKMVSKVRKTYPGVSIFKQEDWPSLISFFKPRMIALDQFWNDAQYSFNIFK